MSLKKALLEQECGGTNSLVGLSQNFAQNNSKLQNQRNDTINSLLPSLSKGEAFAQEYMSKNVNVLSTNTFDMKSLIGAVPQQHNIKKNTVALTNTWTNEYFSKPKTADLNSIWSQSIQQSQPSKMLPQTPNVSSWINSYTSPTQNSEQEYITQEGTKNDMWSSEYLEKFDETSDNLANEWLDEFMNKIPSQIISDDKMDSSVNDIFTNQVEDYENEWEDLLDSNSYFSQLAEEESNYKFNENNPFLKSENSLNIAQTLMKNGNLSDAILHYEAAVQQTPEDSNVWCSLALCHAENEDDISAIKAFNKSLLLNPANKTALLGYSVSLSNEFRENEAVEYLERWLQAHTNRPISPTTDNIQLRSSFLNRNKFESVEKEFLDVARKNSGQIDVELQNALGILYNIGNNYSRAIDSLKLAVSSRPDDPRLWNRLGATLANDDKTTEAISAYRQALNLFPTYVRARYNLGISCMHLNSFEQAIEHLISAIQLQKNPQSSPIWSTLRTAVIRLPNMNSDLIEAVDNKDLNMFINKIKQI
uniref:TPR_REGION domain-containing protein n=1 Tax=Strongyloides stercoralis TaxID=6248 RepID=A0A0K0EMB8_STRER